MATQVYRRERTKGRGINCLTCGDRHWTPYQVEDLNGEWEEAWELCEECKPKTSTRHVVVAESDLERLHKESGIGMWTLREAFLGSPLKQALAIIAWVSEHNTDPMEKTEALLAWARRHRTGRFSEVA